MVYAMLVASAATSASFPGTQSITTPRLITIPGIQISTASSGKPRAAK
jgi:hypothetical protein